MVSARVHSWAAPGSLRRLALGLLLVALWCGQGAILGWTHHLGQFEASAPATPAATSAQPAVSSAPAAAATDCPLCRALQAPFVAPQVTTLVLVTTLLVAATLVATSLPLLRRAPSSTPARAPPSA